MATSVTDVVAGLSLAVLVLAFGEQLSGKIFAETIPEPAYQPMNGGAPVSPTTLEPSTPAPPAATTFQTPSSKTRRKSGIIAMLWGGASPAHPQLVKDLREHILESPAGERLQISRALPKKRKEAFKRLLDGGILNDDEFDDISRAYADVTYRAVVSDSDSGSQSRGTTTPQKKRRIGRIRATGKADIKSVSAKKSRAQNRWVERQPHRVAGAHLLSDDDAEDLPHKGGRIPSRRSNGASRTPDSEDDDMTDEEVLQQEEDDEMIDEGDAQQDEDDDMADKNYEEEHAESQSEDFSEEEASASESDAEPPSTHLVLRALRTPQDRRSLPAVSTHM